MSIADIQRQLSVPLGLAHGFAVAGDTAEFFYETADYWFPKFERRLLANDLTLGMRWPILGQPHLAAKEADGKRLAAAETFF